MFKSTEARPQQDPVGAAEAGLAIPKHIAIIMDGNGRWANKRGLPRIAGHKRGVNAVRAVVREAKDLGVDCLTLFAFSTENWLRPADEVYGLMDLFRLYMRRECRKLAEEGVRLCFIGDRTQLADDIQAMMAESEELTSGGTSMTLIVALNYGARHELSRATQRIAHRVAQGELSPDDVTADVIDAELETAQFPDPDLIIRTSGEQRLSNFMLWQAAYSEFMFVDTLWPDFDEAALRDAVRIYQTRGRRFGGLK